MIERLFFVAVVKKDGQMGISIIDYENGATGLYFDHDLAFESSTQAYGDLILQRLKPDEIAVIATSKLTKYAAATSKHRYPFKFTHKGSFNKYKKAKDFAKLTLLHKQNITLEEL